MSPRDIGWHFLQRPEVEPQKLVTINARLALQASVFSGGGVGRGR